MAHGEHDWNVLFILGLMRSGTTYFRNLLGANKSIQVLGSELNNFWTRVGGAPAGMVEECPRRTKDQLEEELVGRIHAFFDGRYQKRNSPYFILYRLYRKIRYGNELAVKFGRPYYLLNKSTHLHNKISYLDGIFPRAKFIFIIRDIYSHAYSLSQHLNRISGKKGYYVSYSDDEGACFGFKKHDRASANGGYDFQDIPAYWLTHNKLALKSLAELDKSRVNCVSFRDLTTNLNLVLSRLDGFLGLPLNRRVDCSLINNWTSDPLVEWRRGLSDDQKTVIARVLENRRMDYDEIGGLLNRWDLDLGQVKK